MKALRNLSVLFLMFIFLILQACGSGGGTNDTSGTLSISTPSAVAAGETGFSNVAFTVTYTPPSGKTAQGVVGTVSINGVNSTFQLTSSSNSVSYNPLVPNGSFLIISASVNSMTSGISFYVPTTTTTVTTTALTITPALADFLFADPAGSSKTIVISGGTAPYFAASSNVTDIATIFATPTTFSVTLNNAAVSPSPGILSNATVTVTDSATPAVTKIIQVTYMK